MVEAGADSTESQTFAMTLVEIEEVPGKKIYALIAYIISTDRADKTNAVPEATLI